MPRINVTVNCDVFYISEEPEPRECITMDTGSRPVTAGGFTGFLLVVDLATRFISATPFIRQTALIIENIVLMKWISVFGVPRGLKIGPGQKYRWKSC